MFSFYLFLDLMTSHPPDGCARRHQFSSVITDQWFRWLRHQDFANTSVCRWCHQDVIRMSSECLSHLSCQWCHQSVNDVIMMSLWCHQNALYTSVPSWYHQGVVRMSLLVPALCHQDVINMSVGCRWHPVPSWCHQDANMMSTECHHKTAHTSSPSCCHLDDILTSSWRHHYSAATTALAPT